MRRELKVALNGTESNPYHKMGFTQNPLPQTARREEDAACLRMQSLGGDPIPSNGAEAYIRQRLQGWDAEFIELCVRNYRPGRYVTFLVYWDE